MNSERTFLTAEGAIREANHAYAENEDRFDPAGHVDLARRRFVEVLNTLSTSDQDAVLLALGSWAFGSGGDIGMYLLRAVDRDDLQGTVSGDGVTLAVSGYSALVVTPMDSTAPSLADHSYETLAPKVREVCSGEIAGETTISRHHLKILGDMLGRERDTDPVFIRMYDNQGNNPPTLAAGTPHMGMVIMPMRWKAGAPIFDWLDATTTRPQAAAAADAEPAEGEA